MARMREDAGVVVTGGGTGIGRATAGLLAEAGARVVIVGRRDAVLDAAATEINHGIGEERVQTVAADVAVPDEVEAAMHEAERMLQGIDGLVAAAAVYEAVPFLDLTAETFDNTLDIDLRGVALCAVHAAHSMRSRGRGRIVLVASVDGLTAPPESAHYSAAKAGVIGLARGMAVDLAAHGIQVNAVVPGWTRTPMIEEFLAEVSPEWLASISLLRRVAEPEEVGEVIRYVLLEAPDVLIGATICVDGGHSVISAVP
jgi:NAD(P)-dependent dehydrogenase (short-subunit alcohol dehydrogenase family)